jgi:Na+-translocating ferredoxin:NAD+ oxidoreductase subunit B
LSDRHALEETPTGTPKETPKQAPNETLDTEVLVEAIDAVLPQTQCRKCGFDGCLPYARAMATGLAPINRCPPGGDEGIARLAFLLRTDVVQVDAECGEKKPLELALIDEAHCIGCTLCIQACPVDAIVGGAKMMHTVLLANCTGCELCIPPCPVDCITMEKAGNLAERGVPAALRLLELNPDERAKAARIRYEIHGARLKRRKEADTIRLQAKAQAKLASLDGQDEETRRKRAAVERALVRARLRRAGAR